ncbi:MAG: spoIIIJ-associated protein [Acidimicrobiaceae bacterium]|nr:spoIIIJ-associated protein [Acidimicrobiaceae bacterium]
MEWVETTGRTVEEAKDAALDQLGVDEHDAEFEVVEEARLGLFGRVRNEARVRARVRPTTPRPKEDRRDRRKRAGESRKSGKAAAAPASDEETTAPEPPPARERPAPARREKRTPSTTVDTPENGATMEVSLQEQADVARTFLLGLAREFGTEAEIAAVDLDEDTIELQMTGDDLGLLIGPKGQTLLAIQELARTAVQRRTGGSNGRLLVDISGYRAKRRVALERFTREQAAKVLDTGRRLVLEPMAAADRKVVHDTVNDIAGVATTSEGEEPRRRVVITPVSD